MPEMPAVPSKQGSVISSVIRIQVDATVGSGLWGNKQARKPFWAAGLRIIF